MTSLFLDPTHSYSDYRIPAMTVSASGEIYVAFECREDKSDWAKIDIRIMKSVDSGSSFCDVKKIYGDGNTLNNPLLIANRDAIHFLYCENYRRMLHIQSVDGGQTWSEPQEITGVFDHLTYTVLAVGPGHGVVTPEGVLVAPVWLANNPEDELAHIPSYLTTIYSEDNGKTWKAGELVEHDDLFDANETAITLTKEGLVLMSVRNRHPSLRFRYWVRSKTGYSDWEHIGYDERFPDPHCMGSLCQGNGKIFFCNCQSQAKRENLTIKVSEDDFQSFDTILISENGAYSEIAYTQGQLFVLYETYEEKDGDRVNHRLHFKKINERG